MDNIKSINFYYEKNPLYRTVHVDGLMGGFTPNNQLNLNFYATRRTIPKSISKNLLENGVLSQEETISSDSKSGFINEIEFGVYMSQSTAENLYEFLKKTLNK